MKFKTRISCMMYMYKLAGEFIEKYLMEFTDHSEISIIFTTYKYANKWKGKMIIDYDTGNDFEEYAPNRFPDFICEFMDKTETNAPIKIKNLSNGSSWLENFCVNKFLSRNNMKFAVLSTDHYPILFNFIYHNYANLYSINDDDYTSWAIQYGIPINFNTYLNSKDDLYTKLNLNIQKELLIDTLSYKPSKGELRKELNK